MASSSTSKPPVAPTTTTDYPVELKELLERPLPLVLTPKEVDILFANSAAPRTRHRALAYAVLSRLLSTSKAAPPSMLRALSSRLSGTDSQELIEGLSMLTAFLQVSRSLGESILLEQGIRSHLVEVVEYITSPPSPSERTDAALSRRKSEELALVGLLNQAAGLSALRALVRKTAGGWLERLLGRSGDEKGREDATVRTLAAVAVIKLRLGKEAPEQGGAAPGEKVEKPRTRWPLEALMELLCEMLRVCATSATRGINDTEENSILKEKDAGVVSHALEGIACLTLGPPSLKSQFLTRPILTAFYSLLTSKRWNTPAHFEFMVASVLVNVTSYPPQTQSDATVSRLRAFASAQGAPDPVEPVASVDSRVTFLCSPSCPSPWPTIQALVRSSSLPVRRHAGRIIHSLVTPKPIRGQLIQTGAHKLLLALIRNLPPPFRVEDLDPIQAMAKLLITRDPRLVLTEAGQLVDALLALTVPLGDGLNATGQELEEVPLLAKFECLLALTNIASVDGALGQRLAGIRIRVPSIAGDSTSAKGEGRPVLNVLEELMTSSNILICRASTELCCNLVNASGDNALSQFFVQPSSPKSPNDSPSPTPYLRILVNLVASQDISTRLAASGALAALASYEGFDLLLGGWKEAMELVLDLVDPDDADFRKLDARATADLRHRGFAITETIFTALDGAVEGKRKGEVKKILAGLDTVEVLERSLEGEMEGEVRMLGRDALSALRRMGIGEAGPIKVETLDPEVVLLNRSLGDVTMTDD